MSDGITTVTVELLRAGPPHNQLLSPLTQYLGVCGEYAAGIVALPYEHAVFRRKLQELRYDGGTGEDAARRLGVLAEVGVDMAGILEAIPGLSVSLSSSADEATELVHLRLVISASELALLPLELAKVPTGAQAPSDAWLALQAHTPVCITRHVRSVPTTHHLWPTNPKILFVAGKTDELPFEEHLEVLKDATRPWLESGEDPCDNKRLTVLANASLADVERETSGTQYTHIHVLAHGADDQILGEPSFGIELRDKDDGNFTDVVSGDRFASVVAGQVTSHIGPPMVVTVASCDSAQQGGVETPGGSFGYALHREGVPFVVGSQFPLSEPGSVTLTRDLYEGLLWGKNPWVLLADIRRKLHSEYAIDSHDWASIVVYEALPTDLGIQLEEVRYRQARAAVNAALAYVDTAIAADGEPPNRDTLIELNKHVDKARRQLPMRGAYAIEGFGLCASSRKRQAESEWLASIAEGVTAERAAEARSNCFRLLNDAFDDYMHATSRSLVTIAGEPVQREASLHWVLGQVLCVGAIVGRDDVPAEAWDTAKMSADSSLEHDRADERAWSHGSLAELWLLKLLETGLNARNQEAAKQAVARHVDALIRMYPRRDSFEVGSTRRQFQRYVAWWGDPAFSQGLGLPRPEAWDDVRELAAVVVDRLKPKELPKPDPATTTTNG